MKETRPHVEVSMDFETYYSSKEHYSVGGVHALTARQYVKDDRFEPYMVSFATPLKEAMEAGFNPDWKRRHVPARRVFNPKAYADEMDIVYHAEDPRTFDWSVFDGFDVTFVIHNAGFDCNVIGRLFELGVADRFDFDVRDTADMAAYLGVSRHLKGACKTLIGLDVSKAVRASMDGVHFDDLDDAGKAALVRYAADDALECVEIWHRYKNLWPEIEQKISAQNLRTCLRGFRVDRELVESGLETLKKLNRDAESKLPWVGAENPADRAPAASVPALRKWFAAHGYETPKSFNKNDNGFLNWTQSLDKERDAEALAVLDARVVHSGTNPHIARLKVMLDQMESKGGEGDYIYNNFLYFGAHTGRFTGSLGEEYKGQKSVNMLNMPKKPVYGVDMRAMYVPPKGRKFIIFDYSQIEARALLWLVDDKESCAALMDPSANLYVLSAIRQGLVPKGSKKSDLDPKMYQLCKQKDLALGYSMGVWTFLQRLEAANIEVDPVPRSEWTQADRNGVKFCLANQAFLDVSDTRNDWKVGRIVAAYRMVEEWRDANWRIAGAKNPETGFREGGLWRELYAPFVRAAEANAATVWYDLPSGRRKTYYEPCKVTPQGGKAVYMAKPTQSETPPRSEWRQSATNAYGAPAAFKILTGGKLTENYVQAFCRDIMTYGAVEIEEKLPFLQFHFSVYDEVVFSCPEDKCDIALREMPRIMCRGDYIKDWTDGLPLAVDGGVSDHYLK